MPKLRSIIVQLLLLLLTLGCGEGSSLYERCDYMEMISTFFRPGMNTNASCALDEQTLSTPAPSQLPSNTGTSPTPTQFATDALHNSTEGSKPENNRSDPVEKRDDGEGNRDNNQQQPIATFDEWTKQKLQQEQLKIVPPVPDPASSPLDPSRGGVPPVDASVAARNYASRECGAKVIYANPEAENTKAVLNDKERDEYMRNPCDKAEHKQLVIELCETIQPRWIELANFELFSSGPRSVRVLAAERFPSTEWVTVGEFEAADTRDVQAFALQLTRAYAKFIKVELVSHYGSEHYCTLSSIRILGVSMVDEYEAEAVAASRLPVVVAPVSPTAAPIPPVSQPTMTQPPVAAPEGTPSPVGQTEEKSPEVKEEPVKEEEKGATEGVTLGEGTGEKEKVKEEPLSTGEPNKVVGIVEDVSGRLMQKIYEVVNGKSARNEFPRSSSGHLLSASDCHRCPANRSIRRPSAAFCRAFAAEDKIMSSRPSSASFHSNQLHDRLRRRRISELQREARNTRGPPTTTPILPPTEVPPPVGPPVPETATELPVLATQVPPPAVEQRETVKAEKPAVPETPPPPVADTPPPAHSTSTQQSPLATPPPTASAEKKEEKVPESTPVDPPATVFEGLPAASSSHKESVFMKLNKRIAALELNMSLSTEYLSELSRQYIAHTDEQKKHMERTRAAAERVAHDAAKTINETVADQLWRLRKEMESLSSWLAVIRSQATSLSTARRLPAPPPATSDFHFEGQSTEKPNGSSPSTCSREEDEEGMEEEEVESGEDPSAIDMRPFAHHYDGIWTTEQVLYAVTGAQLVTVLLVLFLQFCFQRFVVKTAPPPMIDHDMLDRIVREKLESVLASSPSSSSLHPPPPNSSASSSISNGEPKRNCRRIRKRRATTGEGERNIEWRPCRENPQGGLAADWDSAMDSSLPSPSASASEASECENVREPSILAREEIIATLPEDPSTPSDPHMDPLVFPTGFVPSPKVAVL